MSLMDNRTVKFIRYSSSRSENIPVQTTDVVSDERTGSQLPNPRRNPISSLRLFLTYSLPSTSQLTANTIHELYQAARAQKHLLTSEQISDLIALFGSLSIDTPHPLRSCLVNGGVVRPYWFILTKLVFDKRSIGYELHTDDHYWLMRYHLSLLHGKNKKNDRIAMKNAKQQYDILICREQLHDIHTPYVEALLRSRVLEHLSEAIDVVLGLLANSKPSSPLVSFIWKLLQKSELSTSPDLQSKIVEALEARFEKMDYGADGYVEDDSEHGEPTILDLMSLFASTILPSGPQLLRFQSLLPWAARVTRAALFSVSKISAWRNFCLLALSYSPDTRHIHIQPHDDVNERNTSDWKIVCILAVLDTTFGRLRGHDLPHHLLDSLLKILVFVWDLWISPGPPGYYRPVVVDRAIAAVFLRFAGILRDRSLQMSCIQYALTRGFWYYRSSTVLAVEYATASISCGELNWDTMFPNVGGPELESEVVQKTILSCMAEYPESANGIYHISTSRNIVLSSTTIVALGNVIAKADPNLAAPYLSDTELSCSEVRAILVSVIQSPAILYGSPELLLNVAGSMLFVYDQFVPPVSHRPNIEAVLLSMMRLSTKTASKALLVVHLLHRRNPRYLEEGFVERALRTLIFHRFFSVAIHFNTMAGRMYPTKARHWFQILVLGFARGKARALARQAVRSQANPSIRRSPIISLIKATKFDVYHPNRLDAARILRLVRKDPAIKPRVLSYAIHLLVRARRILAAKKLYSQSQSKFNELTRTYMGNAILHASLYSRRRKNIRRAMKLFRTLMELKTGLGFVPDRVTVNILIKGILMWNKVVGSEQLRALFNYLIVSGYPGGTLDEQGKHIPPFSVTKSFVPLVLPLEQVKMEKILLWKHVQPLYRMFINAFRFRGDQEAAWVVIGMLKKLSGKSFKMKV